MNCKTARQGMEVCRPHRDDLQDVQLTGLRDHLENCAACRQAFHEIQELDALLAREMQNVPVPTGLKERLLSRLSEASCELPRLQPVPRGADRRQPLLTQGAAAKEPARTQQGMLDEHSPAHERRLMGTTRRWASKRVRWLVTAAATAAAIVWVVLSLGQDRTWTPEEATHYIRLVAWNQSDEPAAIDEQTPDPRALRMGTVYAFRKKKVAGRTVTFYRCQLVTPTGKLFAEIYLIPASWIEGAVPNDPKFTITGNGAVALWRERRYVYLFISHGNREADLRKFFQSSANWT